jgi:hypothetical protein
MYTIPFSIDVLQDIVSGKVSDVVIDYNASTIKQKNLITYLSNLNIKNITIDFSNTALEDKEILVVEYIKHQSMCHVLQLEATLLKCLFAIKQYDLFAVDQSEYDQEYLSMSILSNSEISKFVTDNKELLSTMQNILDGIVLFAISNLNDYKAVYDNPQVSVNRVERAEQVGKTFVNLLSNETFNAHYYAGLPAFETLTYYDHYYDRPIYSGKNMLYYLGGDCVIFPLLKIILDQRYTSQDLENFYKQTDAALIQ